MGFEPMFLYPSCLEECLQMDRIEGKHELQKDLRVSIEDYIKNKYNDGV
jgi:hypothetical protein